MTDTLYKNLEWLLPPADDFASQCQAALAASGDVGLQLRALANAALSENQLNRLAKTVAKLRAQGSSLAPLTPFRLAIIGNATTHFMVAPLVASALRHGLALECIEGHYDQAVQEAIDPNSPIHRFEPDAVMVVSDYRGMFARVAADDQAAADAAVEAALGNLDTIRTGIRAHSRAVCIFQTLPRPVETLFGSFDALLPGTTQSLIARFNSGLVDRLRGGEDVLFDVARLADTVGLAHWHNPTLWNIGKLPFANDCLPLYAEHACRLLAALRGKSRRCLVLDLDNTVWGGVIGDDGLEGIVIAQGNPTGEAHLALQQMALWLRERGIVLAVSSKNTDEIARAPFRQHPEMLLKEEHITVFQANWNDKATNIKAIAQDLNLGLDAFVFVDDNPVERNLVRSMLPQVAVPELPADPAYYVRTLVAGGYFEAVAFSEEDRKRAAFYSDNARRVALQKQAGDIDSYLQSLQMLMTVQPFDEVGRARITQLINKSNQYNLTTRRYTEAEVREIELDPKAHHLQIRLKDSFGDNGMISVVICREEGDTWTVDTWVMSCRVLGRKVELAVLQELARRASARGIRRIVGVYLPTDRNALVEDHYLKVGFTETGRLADGARHYILHLDDLRPQDLPLEIVRIDQTPA